MKINISSAKICKSCLFVCLIFFFKFVIQTSSKCYCDFIWRATGTFLVSMERGGPYLSSSTKIIKIRGFIAKIYGGDGNHLPLVYVLQKYLLYKKVKPVGYFLKLLIYVTLEIWTGNGGVIHKQDKFKNIRYTSICYNHYLENKR